MVKKFTIPFASQGDANDIPDALQVDGKVSFTQGFGYDYERPYDDPQAKDIAREDMNGLFKAITSAVGELQTLGASEWSSAISYPKGAIAYYEKDLYISQVDDNQNTPPQNWVSITSIANDSLKKVANLSDLTNKTTARNNLGLGNSATLNKTDVLGTSASLVATQKLVNDTKINLESAISKKADKAYVDTSLQEKRSVYDYTFNENISISKRDARLYFRYGDEALFITNNNTSQSTYMHDEETKNTLYFPIREKNGTLATLSDINKNTAQRSSNGWWKCQDTGIITQWGNVASGDAEVTFPIAFSNYCASVQVTHGRSGVKANVSGAFNITKEKFRATVGDAQTLMWLAIGY